VAATEGGCRTSTLGKKFEKPLKLKCSSLLGILRRLLFFSSSRFLFKWILVEEVFLIQEANQNGSTTRLLSGMATTQLDLLLKDVVKLFRALPSRITVVEEFEHVWAANNIEYLMYAGSSASHAFHPHIVSQLLDIAAAYLYLPSAVAPRAREFGLLLCFFFYFTQPCRPRKAIYVSSAVAESLCKQNETCDFLHDLALVLFEHKAWHVVHFVDTGVFLRAVLAEHENQRARLIWEPADVLSADADDATLELEAELEEYHYSWRTIMKNI
jgi:hypothetical protein